MHTSVIESAQPLFDIPTDENSVDDEYNVAFDDSEPPVPPRQHLATTSTRTSGISGIQAQFVASGVILDDLSFLEPDLCTLADWQAEVDARMAMPTKLAPTRELDNELVSLLTEMKPKAHFMIAATYYMTHPKQWHVFMRNPIVHESCRTLGIAMETLQHRSLESFRRDHANVVPEMVARVRHQAHERERQECIALILQTQPLLQAKHETAAGGPSTPTSPDVATVRHHKDRMAMEAPKQTKEDTDRMRLIREAKLLENAERWKDTKESIRRAATRRADATELGFKKKEFEAEVKRKGRDAKAEQDQRRKLIIERVVKQKTTVELKPQSAQEQRLVNEVCPISKGLYSHVPCMFV
ncbi:hypothetical protein DYB32_008234 [Aphanomyces invadans]|uniref:Uncharacterized protein n=1 Tax=Aphanomyces invadans TaxID=157072 RepID=A0A418ALM4_9STRA|nr:hypothetical protein DYB32_008234 [Aphanomyces invadans]